MGVGSTFQFTVQLKLGSELEVREPVDLDNALVVLVDDNATNRRILTEMLQRWQMQVWATESPTEAYDKLQDVCQRGDASPLLLTDMQMPELDGLGLARRVRADALLAEVPIIVLTSGVRDGELGECKEAGVNAHLMKPVKQSELLNEILNVLGRTTKAVAPAAPLPRASTCPRPNVPSEASAGPSGAS